MHQVVLGAHAGVLTRLSKDLYEKLVFAGELFMFKLPISCFIIAKDEVDVIAFAQWA